jgi:hypothetical protein
MLNRTNKTYFVNKQYKKKKYYKITVTSEEYRPLQHKQLRYSASIIEDRFLTSTIQYGKSIKTISTLFTHYTMTSYDKTQKILNDIFDMPYPQLP